MTNRRLDSKSEKIAQVRQYIEINSQEIVSTKCCSKKDPNTKQKQQCLSLIGHRIKVKENMVPRDLNGWEIR